MRMVRGGEADRHRGLSSRAVHAGERPPAPRRSATVPIYQTAPFLFETARESAEAFASGDLAGLYSRYANPTVRAVEEKLAALEGADDAVAFSSGMAAISSTLSTLLRSGDRLVAAADLYGGTDAWLRWLGEHHPEIVVERVALTALAARLEQGGAPAPNVVYLESPTNPLLTCCDLRRVAELAHAAGAIVVVDNTFATPAVQTPLALGVDAVVHSATKGLAGHSDVTAGLMAGPAALVEKVRHTMIHNGSCLDPHAAFLLARGIKTLALRSERQAANAAALAAALSGHSAVARVCYPGQDPVARTQMRNGGGMLAFELAAAGTLTSGEVAERFLDRLELIQIVPSLGGVESGVMLPAAASHRQLSPAQRAELGIGDGLVRLSCGIEEAADLEADVLQALAAATSEHEPDAPVIARR
jgi:cystathionine beta-lyase/cystathionine gamma-synthase